MEGKIMTPAREYRVSKDESERIRILKMWFAIMVVMIHAIFLEGIYLEGGTMAEDLPIWLARTQYFIAEVVSTCAVPGFFFLSAMFLYRKEFTWAGNMRKKVRSLVVPYFLVTTAWIAVYYIGQHVGALRMYFGNPENNVSGWGLWEWINAYLGINRLDRLGQGFNKPLVGPLWFIRDLFVLNALAVLIKKAIDRAPRLVFLGLVALKAFNIPTHIPVLSQDALVFFCLGYYFVKYDHHLEDIDKLDPVLLAGLYVISVTLDFLLQDEPQQYLVRIATIVLGFVFFFRFTTKIKDEKKKAKLLSASAYAVPVYLFHPRTITILQKLMIRFLPASDLTLAVIYIGGAVIVICLCVAVSAVLKRFVPRFYGVLTGDRRI